MTQTAAYERPVQQPPSGGARATISTGLLLPQDRIVREPLEVWAARLLGDLEKVWKEARRPRSLAGHLAGTANNAALIAAHAGKRALAWRLCEGQIAWQRRLARRARDPGIAAHGIQPWVNLGRLEAIEGKCDAALGRFAQLAQYRDDEWISFGCVRVHCSLWPAVTVSRETLERTLDAIYVVDSLKALLMNRAFDAALDFAGRVPASYEGELPWRAAEASVIAHGRLGNTDRARALAASSAADVSGWLRAVFRLRLAEVMASAGNAEGAREVLRPIADIVRQVSRARKQQTQTLSVMLRLAGACGEAGLDDDAAALAQDVYESAREIRDEVFQIESLRLLAEHPTPAGGEAWADALARLEETTRYVRYRRGGKPGPNPAVEGLLGLLEEIFAE